MPSISPQRLRSARRLLQRWSSCWGIVGVERSITVVSDRRFKRTLGRCYPKRGVIKIHPDVSTAPHRTFAAVLCHEAAHLAVHRLFGRAVAPHGREWATLVEAAGFSPSTRLHLASPEQGPSSTRHTYLHVCPVCQGVWRAKRYVPNWRCPDCIANRLPGCLVVERVATS